MYLAADTAAFGLVSADHVWVEASPKETELTWVKPGDPVDVTVDTYPGRSWNGVVDSIAPASGSEFSILPAQNSSGNWVKVVQRIGIRVRVDRQPDEPALRAGHERRGRYRHRPQAHPGRPSLGPSPWPPPRRNRPSRIARSSRLR